MFFYLSKIVGVLLEPFTLVVILVVAAAALAWSR